jgi:hypothetical protein
MGVMSVSFPSSGYSDYSLIHTRSISLISVEDVGNSTPWS